MAKRKSVAPIARDEQTLIWLRAKYLFHTYSYRDPRAAFAVAMSIPVVSPTTVMLGLASTLFGMGMEQEAQNLIEAIPKCQVKVDAPPAAIFFRAFRQLRRYATTQDKEGKGRKPNIGMTEINQGTREYGLIEDGISVFVGVPLILAASVKAALRNLSSLGTHDSMCSLVGDVTQEAPAETVLYSPLGEITNLAASDQVTVVTLSRFISNDFTDSPRPWRMSGGTNTEIVPYIIPGNFTGTRSGKIYKSAGANEPHPIPEPARPQSQSHLALPPSTSLWHKISL